MNNSVAILLLLILTVAAIGWSAQHIKSRNAASDQKKKTDTGSFFGIGGDSGDGGGGADGGGGGSGWKIAPF